MVSILDALKELNVGEFILNGEPESESEFNDMFRKITGEDDQGTAIQSDDPADFGVTWTEVKTKYDELLGAEPMRLLRAERNQRLANTDWWALKDMTMSQAQKDYRQALRDITETYTSLDDVVWPTMP